jgi:hypothetical protein
MIILTTRTRTIRSRSRSRQSCTQCNVNEIMFRKKIKTHPKRMGFLRKYNFEINYTIRQVLHRVGYKYIIYGILDRLLIKSVAYVSRQICNAYGTKS